jgi:hypothetical protein
MRGSLEFPQPEKGLDMARLFAHLRQQWLGALALLLLLTGGTAYALDGSNTVFTDDIVNGDVRTADLANDGVTGAKLADGAVGSQQIADGSVADSDLAGASFVHAQTVRLQDNPGGIGDSEVLFRIGRVSQSAFCSAESGGALRGGIEIGVNQAGATLVSGDFDVDLIPFDVQFINTAFSDAGAVATQTPFAILDRAAVSASGVAATRVDPATGRCFITVHAVG